MPRSHCMTAVGLIGACGLLALQMSVASRTVVAQETVGGAVSASAATDDFEVLARGPVHEAFAEPVVFDPTPGIVVPKTPPEPIEELPPDEKPAGDNVVWVPGYWAWEEERDGFIWVSGFWRVVPPGRQWVPGYWTETAGGFQFVSGFWAATESEEITYLPAPPATLEVGPSTPAPSVEHVWNPGYWYWAEADYVWRPGFWMMPHPNWIWVPSYYAWCPRGYVFVNGYWDYVLPRRGLLYAPVYFQPTYYQRPGFFYRPSFVVDVTVITSHFFVRPNYCHYYFGDYYAPSYYRSGFYPWFTFHSRRFGYDPIWVHHRHRHNDDWDRRIRREYEHRRDHADARPRHIHDIAGRSRGYGDSLVTSLDRYVNRVERDLRLERIDSRRREDLTDWARRTREFAQVRERSEVDRDRDGRGPDGRDRDGREGQDRGRDSDRGDADRRDADRRDSDRPDGGRRPGLRLPESPIDRDGRPRDRRDEVAGSDDRRPDRDRDASREGRDADRGLERDRDRTDRDPVASDRGDRDRGDRVGRPDASPPDGRRGPGSRAGQDVATPDTPATEQPGDTVATPTERPEPDARGDSPERPDRGVGRRGPRGPGEPDVQVPDVQVPGAETPNTDRPGPEVPGRDLPGRTIPGRVTKGRDRDATRDRQPSAFDPANSDPATTSPGFGIIPRPGTAGRTPRGTDSPATGEPRLELTPPGSSPSAEVGDTAAPPPGTTDRPRTGIAPDDRGNRPAVDSRRSRGNPFFPERSPERSPVRSPAVGDTAAPPPGTTDRPRTGIAPDDRGNRPSVESGPGIIPGRDRNPLFRERSPVPSPSVGDTSAPPPGTTSRPRSGLAPDERSPRVREVPGLVPGTSPPSPRGLRRSEVGDTAAPPPSMTDRLRSGIAPNENTPRPTRPSIDFPRTETRRPELPGPSSRGRQPMTRENPTISPGLGTTRPSFDRSFNRGGSSTRPDSLPRIEPGRSPLSGSASSNRSLGGSSRPGFGLSPQPRATPTPQVTPSPSRPTFQPPTASSGPSFSRGSSASRGSSTLGPVDRLRGSSSNPGNSSRGSRGAGRRPDRDR